MVIPVVAWGVHSIHLIGRGTLEGTRWRDGSWKIVHQHSVEFIFTPNLAGSGDMSSHHLCSQGGPPQGHIPTRPPSCTLGSPVRDLWLPLVT